jgi:serine protease Do
MLLCLNLAAFSGAYLGVYLEDLSEYDKSELDLNHGVKVEMVIQDSPADDAGIERDDILLKVNDLELDSHEQIKEIIKHSHPGDRINLTLMSRNNKREIVVTLGDRNKSRYPYYQIDEPKTKQVGIKLQQLTDQLKEFFGVKHGLLISEVLSDSPAEKAGLKAGDILFKVNQTDVHTINDVRSEIMKREIGEEVTLFFFRDGNEHQAEVEVYETDIINSIDPANEIVFLGRDFDLSDFDRWFRSVFPDSSRKELEKQLERLQEEIDQIRKRVFTR